MQSDAQHTHTAWNEKPASDSPVRRPNPSLYSENKQPGEIGQKAPDKLMVLLPSPGMDHELDGDGSKKFWPKSR